MRKPDLTAYIADKADLPHEKAQQALAAILDAITEALSRDENVALIGFGTFEKRHRPSRMGKNPQTGASIAIEAHNTVNFKPGKALRDALL